MKEKIMDEIGNEYKFAGRKLYIKWGSKRAPNLVIALEKRPISCNEVEFALYDTEMLLCDVYENEQGITREISIGKPVDSRTGFEIDHYLTCDQCWAVNEDEIENAYKQK